MSGSKTIGALMRERLEAEHQATEETWEEAERDREERCAQLESVCRAFGNHNEWSNCHDLGEEAVALALECAEENRRLRARVAELKAELRIAKAHFEISQGAGEKLAAALRTAYQRGAESMRERAAAECEARARYVQDADMTSAYELRTVVAKIRALPLDDDARESRIVFGPPARPLDEWHDDHGDVLWWTFPVCDPPYVGSPLDDDFPDCVTHWSPILVPCNGGERG